MAYNVEYILFDDGQGFYAHCDGHTVGEEPYRGAHVGLGLVAAAVDMARTQKRKVIALCPFAAAMFNRHPEFGDVRLMNAG